MNTRAVSRWLVLACTAASLTYSGAGASESDAPLSLTPPPVRDLPNIPAALDETDADAALEGIQIALAEVADGATYVWHRRDGRLSGMAQPVSSFRDAGGQPCRHLVVMLNTPERARKVEGIACRDAHQRWTLNG